MPRDPYHAYESFIMTLDPSVNLRDILEEEILTGKLKPGERLDEISLAERFGVSRTPVREALFQLAASDLVDRMPRRGNFVAEIGPVRLMEMFDVMAELEGMAARLAARRASTQELTAIRQAHETCLSLQERGELRADEYYFENELFHQAIRNAAKNKYLGVQLEQMSKRLRVYRRLQLRNRGRIRESIEEQDKILRAIDSSDEAQAFKLMRDHLTVQGERFTDLLASIQE